MKYYIIIIFSLTVNATIFSQKYMKPLDIVIGGSPTLIRNDERSVQGKRETELTLAFNIATSLHERVQIGINSMTIFHTDFNTSKTNVSRILGVFGQFSMFSSQNGNIFMELSGNKGNYCTCFPNFPYKLENLYYLGIGAGANFRLYKQFFLDIGFTNYDILNNIKEKYNHTQYIIGINYLINFKKKIVTVI